VLILGFASEIGTELALLLAPGGDGVIAARGTPTGCRSDIRGPSASGAAAVILASSTADDLYSHGPLVASINCRLRSDRQTRWTAFGLLVTRPAPIPILSHAICFRPHVFVAQVSLLTHLAAREAGRPVEVSLGGVSPR